MLVKQEGLILLMSALRILRSICKELGDPDFRVNLDYLISRQFEFTRENEHFQKVLDVIKEFALKQNGSLPSITLLQDEARSRYQNSPKVLEVVKELTKETPEDESGFRHMLNKMHESQTLNTLRDSFDRSSNELSRLVGVEKADKLIERVSVKLSSDILVCRSKVRESKVKVEGTINDPSEMSKYLVELQDEISNRNKPSRSLFTGYTQIDKSSGGFHRGELILIPGYTGELKSTLCRNILYNMATMFGMNVLLFSCEVSYAQTREHFISIHSANKNLNTKPLDYKRIKNRTLNNEEFKSFHEVANDLSNGHTTWKDKTTGVEKKVPYGKIIVKQPSERPFRWSEIVMLSELEDSRHGIDCICLDYYDWVDWDGGRYDDTPMNEMIKASKQLALNFRHGEGVVFISPFQMNNEGFAYANKHDGNYHLSHLSTHNQSRRSADFVISTYIGPEGSKFRVSNQVKICNLKNRDNDPFEPMILQTELSCGRIYDTTIKDTSSDAPQMSEDQARLDSIRSVLRSLA